MLNTLSNSKNYVHNPTNIICLYWLGLLGENEKEAVESSRSVLFIFFLLGVKDHAKEIVFLHVLLPARFLSVFTKPGCFDPECFERFS